MFKVAVSDTYFTPVKVPVPDGTGKAITYAFKAKFKRVSQDELDEFSRRFNESRLQEGETVMTNKELLDEVLVGWDEVADADGNPLEFNDENKAIVLGIYPVTPTLATAYYDSLKTGKQKN